MNSSLFLGQTKPDLPEQKIAVVIIQSILMLPSDTRNCVWKHQFSLKVFGGYVKRNAEILWWLKAEAVRGTVM